MVTTYCASGDDTADDQAGAGNIINQTGVDMDWAQLNANGFYPEDYRPIAGGSSSLLGAGTNVGLTADMDGQDYTGGPYPIGPSNGVDYGGGTPGTDKRNTFNNPFN